METECRPKPTKEETQIETERRQSLALLERRERFSRQMRSRWGVRETETDSHSKEPQGSSWEKSSKKVGGERWGSSCIICDEVGY